MVTQPWQLKKLILLTAMSHSKFHLNKRDLPFISDIDPIRVDTNGVAELLKSLEVHKAAGRDEIPAVQFFERNQRLSCPISSSYLPSIIIPVLFNYQQTKSVVPIF